MGLSVDAKKENYKFQTRAFRGRFYLPLYYALIERTKLIRIKKSLEPGGSESCVFFENPHKIANVVAADKCGGLLYGVARGEQLFCFRYLCGEDVVLGGSSGILFEDAAKMCFAETAMFGQLRYGCSGGSVFTNIIDCSDNKVL